MAGSRSLAEWLSALERAHPVAIDLTLERGSEVLSRLGISFSCPVITVGGTNGKGSTCTYLEAACRSAGLKTALYMSPHIVRFNERVRINGEEVSDSDLVSAFEVVEAARAASPEVSLTYFEFTTLAAWVLFAREKPDVIVLEVGLGGRFDATNMVDPDCSAVTNVGLDHMAFLGDTLDAIGFEKAGIYRPGRPAFYGDANPPATLVASAKEKGAHLFYPGNGYSYERTSGGWTFTMDGETSSWPLPLMAGEHQVGNAALALAVLKSLSGRLPVSGEAFRQAITSSRLPARFERIRRSPDVYLDAAHNPHAMAVLSKNLKAMPCEGKTYAVFGAMADKDIASMVKIVADDFDGWVVTDLPIPRAETAANIVKILTDNGVDPAKIRTAATPSDALEKTEESASNNDRIIAFGSFWVANGLSQ